MVDPGWLRGKILEYQKIIVFELIFIITFSALSASQKASGNPGAPAVMKDLASAETLLSGTLGRFFALAKNLVRLPLRSKSLKPVLKPHLVQRLPSVLIRLSDGRVM